MKAIYTVIFIFICSASYGQFEQQAEKDLQDLNKQFTETQNKLIEAKLKLEQLSAALDPASAEQLQVARDLKLELDALYEKQKIFKAYYHAHGIGSAVLDKYFPAIDYTPIDKLPEVAIAPEEQPEKKVYVMYGDNNIVEKELFEKDEKIKKIFKDIFSLDSKTCVGTFEIPGNRQKIELYRKTTKKEEKKKEEKRYAAIENKTKADESDHKNALEKIEGNLERLRTDQFVYFEDVKFSIRDGCIHDIRARVTDKDGKTQYYFENKVPISMLNYTRVSDKYYLENNNNSNSLKTDFVSDDSVNDFLIKISDVLAYLPNPGNNFVPDDIDYSFPLGDEDSTSSRRVYRVNQDTNLQNIMELRTYTDFLGLFDDSANGIVQFEGKGDFYIAPFQVIRRFPLTLFKKVSPYFHFSRLDEDHKSLTLNTDTTPFTLTRPLEILEKSYLDMGLELDIFGFRIKKEYPFSVNLYYAMRYQIASIIRENEEDPINFKTIGNGAGIRLEFKRFNNFGFNYCPEFLYYNHLNRIELMKEPENFWVFRNEAEIFYYPGESKKQSIFLRLRSFIDLDDGEDSFFQLQFGYRFSIGLGSVKSAAEPK